MRPRTGIEPRIIEAARRSFLERGVDATSLRTIAKRAKTSVGMVYYYFKTKDDLFYAVVEDVYSGLLGDLELALRPLSKRECVSERIGRLYHRLGQVSELELVTVQLVIREMMASSTRRERLFERFQQGHIPLVVQAVFDGLKSGELRSDLPPALLPLVTLILGAVPQLLVRVAGARIPSGPLVSGAPLSEALLELWGHGMQQRRNP